MPCCPAVYRPDDCNQTLKACPVCLGDSTGGGGGVSGTADVAATIGAGAAAETGAAGWVDAVGAAAAFAVVSDGAGVFAPAVAGGAAASELDNGLAEAFSGGAAAVVARGAAVARGLADLASETASFDTASLVAGSAVGAGSLLQPTNEPVTSSHPKHLTKWFIERTMKIAYLRSTFV